MDQQEHIDKIRRSKTFERIITNVLGQVRRPKGSKWNIDLDHSWETTENVCFIEFNIEGTPWVKPGVYIYRRFVVLHKGVLYVYAISWWPMQYTVDDIVKEYKSEAFVELADPKCMEKLAEQMAPGIEENIKWTIDLCSPKDGEEYEVPDKKTQRRLSIIKAFIKEIERDR